MFGSVEEGLDKDGIPTMRVCPGLFLSVDEVLSSFHQIMGAIDVKLSQDHELTLEWDSSASNDMIADSTLALITGIDKSPASVKCKNLMACMGGSV